MCVSQPTGEPHGLLRDHTAEAGGAASSPTLSCWRSSSSSRVRLHDLRSDKIALSLSAHQLGVSAVQMDDWKIVSGGEEGLVSVWDYRMNQKLWEVHSR